MKKFVWESVDKKKSPYIVPDNYFEGIAGRIMGRLPDVYAGVLPQEKKTGILFWLSACSVAAVIAVSFILAGTGNAVSPSYPLDTKFSQAAVSADEDFYDYLLLDEENVYEYETNEKK